MTFIIPRLTVAGLNAAINAEKTKVEINLSHIGFGDGNGVAYNATGTETSLRRERDRQVITGGQKTGPATLQVETVLDGDSTYRIREIGFYTNEGVLFAIWAEQEGPHLEYTPGFQLALGYTLKFAGIPPDLVNVTVNTPNLNFLITGPFALLSTEIFRAHRLAIIAERQRVTPLIQNIWR